MSIAEIAAKGVKQSAARVIFVAVAVLAAAIPFAASCSLGLMFFALQIVAADVVAIFASLFWTAFFWSVMKKKKNNRKRKKIFTLRKKFNRKIYENGGEIRLFVLIRRRKQKLFFSISRGGEKNYGGFF